MTNRIKAQPAVLGEDKAWLLGHLVGDGGVYERRDEGGSVVHVYAGVERAVAELCVRLFESIYGLEATIKVLEPGKAKRTRENYVATCYSRELVADVLSYGPIGYARWRVPRAVVSGSRSIQGEWLSGFFDAEGGAYYYDPAKIRKVAVTSCNLEGLEQVREILRSFSIEHGVAVRKGAFAQNTVEARTLNVFSRDAIERFAIWVGFRSPKKREALRRILSTYKHDEGDPAFDALLAARLAGDSLLDAARKAGLGVEQTIEDLLVARALRGHANHRGDKIKSLLPRIWELRSSGMKWKDVGAAIGIEGGDQKRAIYAINMVGWAKKKGWWPPKEGGA